jgi:hypothetical protein
MAELGDMPNVSCSSIATLAILEPQAGLQYSTDNHLLAARY